VGTIKETSADVVGSVTGRMKSSSNIDNQLTIVALKERPCSCGWVVGKNIVVFWKEKLIER
jgi:hypothetical protein